MTSAKPQSTENTSVPRLTADALFDYANTFARASERAGKGTEYPTVRMAALHFKATKPAVLSSIEDYAGSGYMGLAVGVRIGNRVGVYRSNSEHRIEAYEDEEAQGE